MARLLDARLMLFYHGGRPWRTEVDGRWNPGAYGLPERRKIIVPRDVGPEVSCVKAFITLEIKDHFFARHSDG